MSIARKLPWRSYPMGRRLTDLEDESANVAEFAPLGSIAEEHFNKLFNINVRGTLFTVQKALPLLNDGGSIILTGSVAGSKSGAIKPIVAKTFPLTEAADALRYLVEGRPFGRVILTIAA
jgi:NAD(P)-dependent dehydrogenase (short-subunit alcohol dehydrogenase family)